MIEFRLRGLAEGLVGKPTVLATSVDAVFRSYPQLASVRGKLRIDGNTISGFAACDG